MDERGSMHRKIKQVDFGSSFLNKCEFCREQNEPREHNCEMHTHNR